MAYKPGGDQIAEAAQEQLPLQGARSKREGAGRKVGRFRGLGFRV